jgi:hypothetical protein
MKVAAFSKHPRRYVCHDSGGVLPVRLGFSEKLLLKLCDAHSGKGELQLTAKLH